MEQKIQDAGAAEQLRLLSSLDDDDRRMIYRLIDTAITNRKFRDSFKENVQTAKGK